MSMSAAYKLLAMHIVVSVIVLGVLIYIYVL